MDRADKRGALALLNMAARGEPQLLKNPLSLLLAQIQPKEAKADLALARAPPATRRQRLEAGSLRRLCSPSAFESPLAKGQCCIALQRVGAAGPIESSAAKAATKSLTSLLAATPKASEANE